MNHLVFTVDNQQFALPIDYVERVIWAVAITPINDASANLLGMINVQNTVIPTVNLRKSLNLSEKNIDLSDQFIICQFPSYKTALWVDRVLEISDHKTEECSHIENEMISSVIKKNNELILVYDWESLISNSKAGQV